MDLDIRNRKYRHMNKHILKSIVLFAVISFVFDACQKDTMDNPATSTTDRDIFLGTWSTTSSGTIHGTLSFSMNITAGASSASQIKIENFDAEGSGTFVLANISGTSVSIQQQVINGDTIQGTGTYNNNNTLSFTYTFRDGQTVDNRTATAHK